MSTYHLFSIPSALLDSLAVRSLALPSQEQTRDPSPPPHLIGASGQASSGHACGICLGVTFADVFEQRSHFRSDWHRYNAKLKLRNGQPIPEAQFASLVDALEDSLSGSASSADDSDIDSDKVTSLLSKANKGIRSPSPTASGPTMPRTALAWFHSPPSTQIGVYNAVFPPKAESLSLVDELKAMQGAGPTTNGRHWTLFMVAGGHFAGMVVRVSRPDQTAAPSSAKKKGQPKPEMEIILHKTFHRYTTRKKQGGSQSVNDNAKGFAKSAGAQLRRYGEQALKEDIRNLMTEWAPEIADSERIWIRASVSNKRIFYEHEQVIITKDDERLRGFPFPTRRPTQSELTRCLNELTRVKVTHFTEDELRLQDEAYQASLPKPKPPPTAIPAATIRVPEVQKLTKEEEAVREKWRRLVEMVRKGRLEALKTFWDREHLAFDGVDGRIPDWIDRADGPGLTLLQFSAAQGQAEVTQWLLDDLGANPTLPITTLAYEDLDTGVHSDTSDAPPPLPPSSRRTAYDLAKARPVRDVFRKSAADRPDKWDWLGAARVPSALSLEMQEERDGKRKARRKGLKDKLKEREKERAAVVSPVPVPPPEPPTKPTKEVNPIGPRKLGGSSGAADGVAGLTPEMRARVERERRARAAEARMMGTKGMPGGSG